MILAKFHLFLLTMVQQVPPPPDTRTKMGPTPPGDAVPIDSNAWILIVVAILLIIAYHLPRTKKAA